MRGTVAKRLRRRARDAGGTAAQIRARYKRLKRMEKGGRP